ncbi:acetyltransferase [Pontibacter korlensis]|uniref:Acetyltransferase n=1 Tax=Pontibacter korlensis TaxID=400092 RepID=A0A0E3ZBD6_9BACT|nr:acetyltransferase [Pontibacter korlensis]AKD01943.1 acetyltransferase [Pontibacter korlensis]
MYLYGASGHAKVIIDILGSIGVSVAGLFDDNPDLKELAGIKVLGAFSSKQNLDEELIISIGNNSIRAKIAEQLNVKYGQAIAKTAILSPTASVGEGTVVMQGAILQADVLVGKHAIINTGAKVDHDCRVGDFAHLSPGAVLCGNVSVGEGTWIGAGAVVIPGIKIGKWCKIGAGAVVIRDIPNNAVAVGNPGKIIKYC